MLDKNFDAKKVEEKRYADWEKSGRFACDVKSNKTPYVIPMPPPNVTGNLHIGHALNMTLQDILARFQRMQGKDTLWQPGTDHAGIATQMIVTRQLDEQGIDRQELGREKFLGKVWDWKETSGNAITSQLRRLGASPDWERERFTMDEGLNNAVRKVFVQLHSEGLIYKDKRLVNWHPELHTSVSDLEVSSIEKPGHMWHLRYPLENNPDKFIEVGTTRPETMLGDTAIAVNPDDERYKDLIGQNVVLPIVGRIIPIVADSYADPEQGTGAVKITPAHDFNDYDVGKRNNLEMINILDQNACINEDAPEKYQGMDRFKARKQIIADFKELGLLGNIDDIMHAVPYDEKTKTVILEPWLTDQWYCDAETLAKPAIEAVEQGKTEFVPKTWEKTYFEWMRNIQPWCISRQLWWGHRIPAWYDDNGNVFVAETVEEAQAQAGAGVALHQDEDVLDTWFSSALWPFSTLGWPDVDMEEVVKRYYPADTLVTGFDIIFFWVARMMMMGIHFMGEVPFKTVYMHALVRDENGIKMSKTKGNVIDPLTVIDKYGADALRYTLTSMAAQGRDIKLSEDRVEIGRNFTTKIWNAAKYCEMNACEPVAGFKPEDVTHSVNKWIISELADASRKIASATEDFRFNEAASAGYQFARGIFCDWYLEFTKPLLNGDDESIKFETKATTGFVLDQIMIILHPIMPYLTEELHAHLTGHDDADSWLLNANWPVFEDKIIDQSISNEMDWVIRLITSVRSVRSDMNVPAGAKINMIIKDMNAENKARLDTHGDIIKRMARLENIDFSDDDAPKGAIQTIMDEATIILPVADVMDMGQERARLQKEIDKMDKEIDFFDKKLSNENFVSRAPEHVIEEQRSRKADAEDTKAKLQAALAQIEAA